MEVEPEVLNDDVARVLERSVADEDDSETVATIAEKAGCSTRTVYRVLGRKTYDVLSLDLADRLLVAAGGHLTDCRVRWPDGRVE